MSVENHYYIIAGYDLSNRIDNPHVKEWFEDSKNDKWYDKQRVGEIQVFKDFCCGEYLYFGYILSVNDEYEYKNKIFSLSDFENKKKYVDNALIESDILGGSKEAYFYSIISFCESV